MLERPAESGAGPAAPRSPRPASPAGRAAEPPPWISPAALLGALRRRKWALILSTLLTPTLALVALEQTKPRYAGTGSVIYEPAEFAARELQSILRSDPTTDEVMASQAEIVASLPAAMRLAEKFDLYASPEFNWMLRRPSLLGRIEGVFQALWRAVAGRQSRPLSPDDIRHSVELAVQDAINVKTLKQTRVMEVSFTTEDQGLAAAATNLLMGVYIDGQREAKVAAVNRATAWLNDRVAELRRDVQAAEDRIASYRAANGLVQGVQAGLDTEQISRINVDLEQARSDLAQAQGRLDAARGRSGPAAQAAVAPSVVGLRAERDRLAAKLHAMFSKLGPNHPEAIALGEQLAATNGAVTAETGRVVAATEGDVRAARARVASLERSLRDAQAEIARKSMLEIPLNAMQRDAEASRSLLQAVLDRLQQTAQQAAIEMPDARLVSPALMPAEPSFPRTKLMLAAASAFGVLFGLLLVLLLEASDSTFPSGEDVRARLGLPCLALVPQVPRRALRGDRVGEYGARKPLSPFAEQLRALRAGLWLRTRQPKVVAITAARPAEGKTTIAMALARSAAINGERTIVVDCDIRQPSLAQLIGADAKAGLADCLLGHADLARIVQRDALTSACFIPAGSAEANAAGLFMSDSMGALLSQLRNEYDLVLLDAPPALALADARLLARLADATLLCLRWRHTPYRVVRNALDLLAEAGAEVAGVVLTRVDARAHLRAGFADSEIYHPRYGGYFRE